MSRKNYKVLSSHHIEKGVERNSHLVYFFVHEGKKSEVATYLSHNKQDINDALQRGMAEQICLSKTEFAEMVSCKIGHDALAARYADLGLLQKD